MQRNLAWYDRFLEPAGSAHERGERQCGGSIAVEALEQLDQRRLRDRLGVVPVVALHVARGDHRVDDRLLGRLRGGLEQRIEMVVADEAGLLQRLVVQRLGIGGRERDEDIARAVARVAAHPRQAHAGALGDALQLVRQQRRVGGDHDDDRAGVAGRRSDRCRCGRCAGTGRPARRRCAGCRAGRSWPAPARRSCSRAVPMRDAPRGRADAALEFVADHAGAAADVALGDRAALRLVQRARRFAACT